MIGAPAVQLRQHVQQVVAHGAKGAHVPFAAGIQAATKIDENGPSPDPTENFQKPDHFGGGVMVGADIKGLARHRGRQTTQLTHRLRKPGGGGSGEFQGRTVASPQRFDF